MLRTFESFRTKGRNVVRFFQLLDSKSSWILIFFGGICCGFSMFLITADVLGRYLFNAPIPGTLEVTEFLLCIIVFGGLTFLEIRGEHVRILLVHSRLKARPQFVLNAIGKALSLFLFGFMTWQTFGNTIHSYVTGEATWGQVSIPIWIGKAFICLGSLMLTLHLLGSLILDVGGKRKIPIPASPGKPLAE